MSSTALVFPNTTPQSFDDLAERCRHYLSHGRAENTIRAYRSDWRDFDSWCQHLGAASLPATNEIVAAYIAHLADCGCKASTIQRRITAISQAHEAASCDSPTKTKLVRATMSGVRRAIGIAQHGKQPLLTADIRTMCQAIPDDLVGLRDRALILLGYAGAFRRSELAAIRWEDLDFKADGVIVFLTRSKIDQEASGRQVGIPYGSNPATCPVRCLAAWRHICRVDSGPVFRRLDAKGRLQSMPISSKMVATVVKRAARRVGLDSAQYAGHSLRAGLATQAALNGVSERVIMSQTGHRNLNTVRKYIRQGSLFRENAAFHLGL
jgi:site-specific recombinase XerD